MKNGTIRAIALVSAAVFMMSGCDMFKRLSSGDTDGDKKNEKGFFVDEEGNTRLNQPDDQQQRFGKDVSTTELSNEGASSGTGQGWVNKAPSKGGSFLLASTSTPGTPGGDMPA